MAYYTRAYTRPPSSLEVKRRSYGDHDHDGEYSRRRLELDDYGSRRCDEREQRRKRERVPRGYDETRRYREDKRHKKYGRTREKEVSYSTRNDSFYRYDGGGTNPTCTPSRRMDTHHEFHSPKLPCEVYTDLNPSKDVTRASARRNHALKCEDIGYEAKRRSKPLDVLPTTSLGLRTMEYEGPNTDTFHMTCKVEAKTCLVIIDNGSGANLVSERLVSKLSLVEVKPLGHKSFNG